MNNGKIVQCFRKYRLYLCDIIINLIKSNKSNFNFKIMKTRSLFLSFVLFFVLGAAAQTANYNADGTYKGTPVTSIDVDFSTLIGKVNFSKDIQECLNVGVVKFYVPDASAYPTTGSPVSYYLYTNGGSPGIDVNSIASPAYIYLPTMSQGVGAIVIDGAVNNQALAIEYTNNNGVTWNPRDYAFKIN